MILLSAVISPYPSLFFHHTLFRVLLHETMVDLGVRFENKGNKSAWKLHDPTSTQIYHLCPQTAPQAPP